MVVTHGGLEGGYGLYLRDNKPTFVYNFLSIDRPTFTAKDPLPKGKTTTRRRLRLRRRRHGQGRQDHHVGQRQKDRRGPPGKNHSHPVLAGRRTRRRHATSAPPSTSPTRCPSSSPARSTRSRSTCSKRLSNEMRETAAVDDMVRIEGGEFTMGSVDFYPEERPFRRARVANLRSTVIR